MEGSSALMRNTLPDNIRLGLCTTQCLSRIQAAAGAILSLKLSAVLLGSCLVAETVISMSARYEHLGVLFVHVASLGLDIRPYGASDIRSFVVL